MMTKSDLFFYSVIGEVAGIYYFFKGFKVLKEKRRIQNVPTSTIRAIPIGEVEIKGKAKSEYKLKTPISKISCVFFSYIEEEFRRVGKSYKWVKLLDIKSDFPFYIEDETGTVKIDPKGADLKLVNKYVEVEGRVRKTEYYILEKENVYVIGTAKKLPSFYDIEREEVEKRIQEIMENPEEKIKLDKNKDMWIDEKEWQMAREEIKKKVREELMEKIKNTENQKNMASEHLKNVVVGKGENSPFIISTLREEQLVEKLKGKTSLMIFGGVTLIIVCLGIILSLISNGLFK